MMINTNDGYRYLSLRCYLSVHPMLGLLYCQPPIPYSDWCDWFVKLISGLESVYVNMMRAHIK